MKDLKEFKYIEKEKKMLLDILLMTQKNFLVIPMSLMKIKLN